MTPKLTLNFKTFPSPLGSMLMAANEQGVCGIWFEGQRHQPDTSHWTKVSTHPLLEWCEHELNLFYKAQLKQFSLPLCSAWGSPFQQSVWQALRDIEHGKTTTYQGIAQAISNPKAVRAVGAAIGKNPWTIVVPCHRVLGQGGQLTGYAGGVERKAALLELEKASSAPCT